MYHSSGYLHIEYQLGLLAYETIRYKYNIDRFFMYHGVFVDLCLSNNGIICTKVFLRYIKENFIKSTTVD